MAINPFKIGDKLYRVDGTTRGEDLCDGFELLWQEFQVVRVTQSGAWLVNLTWPYKTERKKRFALAGCCRWGHATREGALRQLMRRKSLHVRILESQLEMAREVQEMAKRELLTAAGQEGNTP